MTTPQLKSTTKTNLYEQDFYLWIETTAKQLKAGKFAEIDLENLIEEIESMGRIEKRTLESNLVVLLMHLLKYKCQPEKRSKSCLSTIFEHRRRLNKHFQDSPSLKKYFLETFVECYQDARQQASIKTGLLLDIFPVESPFNTDECLNQDFLPD
ncbi:hypothetical protein SR1949_37810 [Sphaerospermopsis reniformis]|uniref:DUF29 domain-containing protein n=1 Tax=Sphaerospermopsis reniformis TaxID=531300 RepID=A0A480A4T2_9CYAN|nr:DUF29 domain-containing protein [Sphaerospermopsis reniformis]GCL38663.1 hypothetical protein SR1949_37810 [Sphaerospermopsis reniformis]